MFRILMPKETNFFDYFEEHCSLLIEASRELVALSKPGANIGECVNRIGEFEHQTDDITHRCLLALEQTFITPFDRLHIHALIKGLDDIVDTIDDAASRLLMYEVTEVRQEFQQLAALILDASCAIMQSLKCMRNLKEESSLKEACIAVHRIENQADDILREAIRGLFKESITVLEVIKWKEMLEVLEFATDRCEDVADLIQGIIIEAS